jgi:N-acetylmuramoyl-L-alanine amidase
MNRPFYSLVLAVIASGLAVAQRTDLSGVKICIDPGHGGHNAANDRHLIPDLGTDFWESESNFQKALLLKALLEVKGATVLLTRNTNDYPTDAEPSLATRVAFANANNVTWFHSIHSNATGLASNTSINYTLMLVREEIVPGGSSIYGPGTGKPEKQGSWDVSLLIGPNIKGKLRTQRTSQYLDWTFYGGANGGYTLGVLRGLTMPGQLSEGSMHHYYPETRRLMNNSYLKMEAYAIRDAFLQYFSAPADTLCIIAGILKNSSGSPINGVKVRLLPENIIYNGDNYNNGFYMFDSIRAGSHTLSFETPNYTPRTQQMNLTAGSTTFVDGSFEGGTAARVTYASPSSHDTLFAVSQWIAVNFSQSMDTSSFRQSFLISPALAGTITWYNGQTLVWFKPSQPFQYGTWYTYRIDGTARTTSGGPLDGNGDGTGGDAYSVTFRTEQSVTSVRDAGALRTFALYQNFPNPFNPATVISYQIIDQDVVTLKVFDLLGREVVTLVDGVQAAGQHVVRWDGRNYRGESVSSGVYLYQLRARSSVLTREMVLLK